MNELQKELMGLKGNAYKRHHKERENKKNEKLWDIMGCKPSIPKKSISETGEVYYVEGSAGKRKRRLKKQSNKATRKIQSLTSGASYKKQFPLVNDWY